MSTQIEKYLEITKLYNEAVKTLKKNITKDDIIHGLFDPLFEKHPEILRLRFHAFTPYYSDGDPCTFGISDLWYASKDLIEELKTYAAEDGSEEVPDDETLLEEADEWYSSWGGKNEELKKDMKEASSSLQSIKNLVEDLIGDGIEVTMKRGEEFKIDEYSHD